MNCKKYFRSILIRSYLTFPLPVRPVSSSRRSCRTAPWHSSRLTTYWRFYRVLSLLIDLILKFIKILDAFNNSELYSSNESVFSNFFATAHENKYFKMFLRKGGEKD